MQDHPAEAAISPAFWETEPWSQRFELDVPSLLERQEAMFAAAAAAVAGLGKESFDSIGDLLLIAQGADLARGLEGWMFLGPDINRFFIQLAIRAVRRWFRVRSYQVQLTTRLPRALTSPLAALITDGQGLADWRRRLEGITLSNYVAREAGRPVVTPNGRLVIAGSWIR